MRTGNLKRGIPALLPEELFTSLARGSGMRVERIVSRGHASPPGFWYDQAETELVFLLQGHARLEIAGQGELDLSPMDFIELPPHTRHRVSFTSPTVDTIWLAVFYDTPREAPRSTVPPRALSVSEVPRALPALLEGPGAEGAEHHEGHHEPDDDDPPPA